ncbi:MAG: class II histone deacetylase [Defluviitaleaceae bacterium]|nr:class II histone deacetylase [Defluviitaleaceae bacterium]
MRRTAFVCDEKYFWHDAGSNSLGLPSGGYIQPENAIENPESKRRIKNLLEASGLYDKLHIIKPYPAKEIELQYYHTVEHIKRVKELSKGSGGDCGELTIVGKGSFEIALLAAGGTITAVEAVTKEECDNAYALVRPPGHHAVADMGMGFCIFNNAVIATEYARRELGYERILIIDWDAHHGNGIEDAYYNDPNVLYISLHQEGLEAVGRGEIDHIGEGEGKGFTVNIPLYAGTGDAGYIYAMEQIVKPMTDNFKPQLIIISAGQDANFFDPLARMMLTTKGYRKMTKIMMELANVHCKGKLICTHEGGYSTSYVPFCTHAIIEELSGVTTDVGDPFIIGYEGTPYNVLYDHQKKRVDEIKAMHNL